MKPRTDLPQALEAILFVAPEPVTAQQMAQACGASASQVTKALDELGQHLSQRGIRLTCTHKRYSLASAPEHGQVVERFLGAASRIELTKPALETLAIVAYQQPVTKSQIESIRGVSSEQTIKNLLLRGLIEEGGRLDVPGRPIIYHTSTQFLHLMGISRPEDLPKPPQPNPRANEA